MGGLQTILTLIPPSPPHWDGWLETGTYNGSGSSTAIETTRAMGHTVDINITDFHHPLATCWLGDSATLITPMLEQCHGHLLVWLDAHFPSQYQTTGTERPLQTELDALAQWSQQPGNTAYIYIDDARILGYPAENGPCPTYLGPPTAIPLDPWCRTHRIWTCSAGEGYVVLLPRPG